MNLAPFLPLSPNDIMNWVKKLSFRKMNIIIEFIVQKYAQVTNFTFLVHSVIKLGIWRPFYPCPPMTS